MQNVELEILAYDQELALIDQQMKECIREQAYAQDQTRDQLSEINKQAVVLIDKIQSVKANASQS